MRAWRGISIVLCSCLVVLVTGCSLINPHVKWTAPQGKTLDDAITYANGAKKAYKTAVGDQAVLSNSLAMALIPAGALAIGLATHPGNADTILAIGLGGGAAYGIGSWLSSKPRQLVYLNGIKAIDCAVKVMLPLNFTSYQESKFNSELESLGKSITTVTDQITKVADLLDTVSRIDPTRKNVMEAAKNDISIARTTVESARTIYASGIKLAFERDRAGQILIVAIDDIGAEVDRAIVATLPDLQALPGIVGGLAQTSSQFGKVSALKGAGQMTTQAEIQGAPRKETINLNTEKAKLKNEVMKLQNHAQYIAAVVNSVRDATPDSELKQCGVEALPAGLNVEPSVLQFQPGKNGTRRLLVSGGKPPYMAEMEDVPTENLMVTSAPPWIILQATEKITAGTYTLLVTDTALNTKAVSVIVGSGTQSGKPDASKPKPASPTADEAKKVALALCLPDTEKWGSDRMVDGIKIFQDTIYPGEQAKVTGQLTQEELGILMQESSCKPGRKNYYENSSLTEEAITGLQKALKTGTENGQLDQPTRDAIRKRAQELRLTPSDGTLTSEIAKKIGGSDAPTTP